MRDQGVVGKGLRVLRQAIREEPGPFAVGVAGAVLHSLVTIGSSFVLGAIVARIAVPAIQEGRVSAGAIALAVAAILAVSALKVSGMIARRLGAGAMQFRLQATYRRRVTRRYLRLPLSWHHKHSTGELLSNANADVEAVWFPIAPFPFAVGTLAMLVVAGVALFVTDWAMALVGLAVFPLVFALNVIYSRRMSPRVTRVQELRADVSTIAHESFDGALVVKTMGRETEETTRFAAKADELRDGLIRVGRIRGAFDPLIDSLPNIGTLAVLVVGTWRMSTGAADIETVTSVVFLFTVLAFPIRAIGWVLGELPRSVVGWERVTKVLSATGDMEYGPRETEGHGTPATLEFRDVTYTYPDGSEVLHSVNLEIPAGRTVALVGPTGSGKSTIASLATRLVDPDDGRVLLDGNDVRELGHGALADNIALVQQVPFVFDDTIGGNITLARDSVDGDDDVWTALRTAQADGFVAKLPDQLDTEVGERGHSLSGGQRQRITLARALAGAPRLLVLDDATSAVDPRVESAILGALKKSKNPASVLVVAYRRATIALADEVVYLEHGKVVATGTHLDLLDNVPGYANLVTAYEREEAERAREGAFIEAEDTEEEEVSA
ncbi:ABC-type multidrug transport system fused ATPase/permease subunit [Phytomonospora endophytica]|uniref:ABC-type multidrug transport system fused ATPase/permease subunit n=1 Tax=Phytomonospora endophytica TaxID=714109 RepID=A0A841FJI7_9ACTN|nr:ABC-type multidrug transport system fused ATPase/permease subunit [Phytomonospora endophytica]GIG66052.1 multidrug ABC transporter ATP-binding protein [Phytomonospora endophytica]